MSNEEIQADCQIQYEAIRKAEERLKELRALCKHENTFEGNYSWRPGAINRALICTHCGSCLKFLDIP